jgi:hypothetical protein
VRGGGSSAIFGTHTVQYTRCIPLRRSHNPPQRSWEQNKKALRRFPGHRARFCYDDLLGLFSYELLQVQMGFLLPFLRQLSIQSLGLKAP